MHKGLFLRSESTLSDVRRRLDEMQKNKQKLEARLARYEHKLNSSLNS